MPSERLVAAYLLRVAFRDGRREVRLQPLAGGDVHRFASYAELAQHLRTREDDDRPHGDEPSLR